jgi:diguanylate cyclase (GGDEF)-like protein/PAS domain S-box-containing protein
MARALQERQVAECLLHNEQQRLRMVTDHLQDVIGYIDGEGRYRYVNSAVRNVLGYDPQELLKKTPFEFVHPEERACMEEYFTRLLSTAEPGRAEFRFCRADGSYLWVEVFGRSISAEKNFPGELVFTVRDVHHRHLRDQALQQNMAMVRALLDSPTDAALLIDRNGLILEANEAALLQLHRPIEMVLGRNVYELSLPHLNEVRRRRSEEVLVSGKAHHFEETYGKATFETTIYPILDEQGEVEKLAVFIRDISRYRQAEQAERERSEQLRRANALIAALTQVSTRCETAADVDELLHEVGSQLKELGFDCLVALIHSAEQRFVSRYLSLAPETLSTLHRLTGFSIEDFSFRTDNFPPYETLAQQHQGWFASDLREVLQSALPGLSLEKFEQVFTLAKIDQTTRAIFAPLLVREQLLGLLGLWGNGLQADDVPAAMLFADQIANALEKARLYAEVQRLSMIDELTGIYNRRGLFSLGRRELERAQRFQRPLSVMMLDVDHFKEINDTLGHAAGDDVLMAVATCCQRSVRELDVVARYGGDEFAIVLVETDAKTAEEVRQRLLDAISALRIERSDWVMHISISCGVAVLDETMSDLETLLDRADRMLYQHKRRWRVDNSEMPVIH